MESDDEVQNHLLNENRLSSRKFSFAVHVLSIMQLNAIGLFRSQIERIGEKGVQVAVQELLEDKQPNHNFLVGGLHKAVDDNDLTFATRLLEEGASPNTLNSKGLTALYVAAMKERRPMVELILEKSKVTPDLDSYKDNNGETTRDVLKKKMPDLPLPPHIKTNPDINDLFYHLSEKDETSFLNCLRSMPNNAPIDVQNMIELVVLLKFENAACELLKRLPTNCNLETAANIAIELGLPRTLSLIMNYFDNRDPDAVNRLLLNASVSLGYPNNDQNCLECFRLIIDREDVDIYCTDKHGRSPLYYAARANNQKAVMILLEKGNYIGHTVNAGKPVVSVLSPSTLSQYFDDCIQFERGGLMEDWIMFDYKCLIPPTTSEQERNREMDVFQHIAGNDRLKHLLKHPLLSSFIYRKWRKIRTLRYLNFVLYILHYVLLCGYMTYLTFKEPPAKSSTDSPHNGSTNASAITQSTSKPPEESLKASPNDIIPLQIVISLFLTVFLSWKLFQIIEHTNYYCSKDCTWGSLNLWKCFSCLWNELQYGNLYQYVTNWAEVVLEVLGFCVLWGVLPRWLYAVLILPYSWLLMVSWGDCATLFLDIAMYKTVLTKFLRFLVVYGILIFAFMNAFFILLKAETFGNLQLSIFQTIIMLTGDLNADSDLFNTYPLLSRLIFVVFIFMIVIVFFNLLVGLAVSDTAEIIGQAELVGLYSMVKLISHMDIITNTSYGRVSNYWLYNLIATIAGQIPWRRKHFSGTTILVRYDDSEMDSIVIDQVREILLKRGQRSEIERIIDKMALLDGKISSVDDKLSLLNDKLKSLIDFRDSRSKPGPSGV